MPKVNIEHECALDDKSCLTKIKSFFEQDQDLKKLDPKISVNFDKNTGAGKVTGSQFKADILVKPMADGSKVTVVVDLPLLLSPFKGKVQEMIQKKLAKHLG